MSALNLSNDGALAGAGPSCGESLVWSGWHSVVLPAEKLPEAGDNGQLKFWELGEPLLSLGALRSWTGDFFEEACKQAANGVRYATDSQCAYCPDIGVGRAGFIESKAVGGNGSMILYRCRLEKDIAFSASAPLAYWLWRHDFKVNEHEMTREKLRDGLAAACHSCCVVPLSVVVSLALEHKLRQVNSGYTQSGERLGYGKNGYGIGWTIPFARFQEHADPVGTLKIKAYGRDIACTLYATRGVQRIVSTLQLEGLPDGTQAAY